MSEELNEFEREMARIHGWPIHEFRWHLRRSQLRNWQRHLAARNARLTQEWNRHGSGVPVSYCPRCGEAQAWQDKDQAMRHEFEPLSFDDIYCGSCDEHFSIKSIPSPYSQETGWSWRRRVWIGQRIAKAI